MNQIAETGSRSVVSVHTKPETVARLDTLAQVTRRSKSFLANDAIERYLQDEEAFVASVASGQADITAGRTYSTQQVIERLQRSIDKVAGQSGSL